MLRPKQSSWLMWAHLPLGSGELQAPALKLSVVLEGVAFPAQWDRRKRLPVPTVAFAQKHSFPALPGSALTWGTIPKHCLPFQMCFSYRDSPQPHALSAGRGQSHRHILLTQSPWLDPAPCLSWHQMPNFSLICGGLLGGFCYLIASILGCVFWPRSVFMLKTNNLFIKPQTFLLRLWIM